MPSPISVDRATLTIEETAARLGIDRGTAYRLAKDDRLPVPVLRVGKRLLIGRAALDRVLAGESLPSTPERGNGDAAA